MRGRNEIMGKTGQNNSKEWKINITVDSIKIVLAKNCTQQ